MATEETKQAERPDPSGRAARLAAIDSVRERNITGREAERDAFVEADAVEPPESAPEAYDDSQDEPAEQERAEDPVTLTGEESDEELTNLGYQHSQPKTAERIRRLARERNEASQQLKELQARLERLEAGKEESRLTEAATPKQPRHLTEDDWKFDEKGWRDANPEPDRDDYDAHAKWEYRLDAAREAHGQSIQQVRKLAEAIAPQLAEVRHSEARKRYEQEWDGFKEDLNRFGTSREEIEPAVLEIIRQHPTHSVESAGYLAMKYLGVLDGAKPGGPKPAPVQKPGQGRTEEPGQRATGQKKKTLADTRREVIQTIADEAQKGAFRSVGGQTKAVNLRTSLINTIRERNN